MIGATCGNQLTVAALEEQNTPGRQFNAGA